MSILVNCKNRRIKIADISYPCRIGRGGFIDHSKGRESDEKTPLGEYRLRFGLYRADRLPAPKSALTFRAIRKDDGWCDAPKDLAYNRFIRLPYQASHEKLWREDGAYDIILVMSHNDSPPQIDEKGVGFGSAVFIHIAQPDERETLGCIALAPEVMVKLLGQITTDGKLKIV